jgi:uncharacterized membrane protein YcaP (DUF421 family)
MPEWLSSPKMWSDIFALGAPVAEKVMRPALVYVFLVLALRVFGKRELAQLNPFDLVVLLSLSNTVQNAIIGNDNSVLGGLVGALTLLIFNWVVVRFLYRHHEIDEFIEGDTTVLVENGCVIQHALDKEVITIHELEAAAHKQGFETLKEVEKCILEPGGTLAMFGRKPSSDDLRQQAVVQRLDRIEALLVAQGPQRAD